MYLSGKELAIATMEARIASLERQLVAREREVSQLHHLLAQQALNQAPARLAAHQRSGRQIQSHDLVAGA